MREQSYSSGLAGPVSGSDSRDHGPCGPARTRARCHAQAQCRQLQHAQDAADAVARAPSLGKLRLRQITDGCSGSASSGAIQSAVASECSIAGRRLVRRAAYTATRMAPMGLSRQSQIVGAAVWWHRNAMSASRRVRTGQTRCRYGVQSPAAGSARRPSSAGAIRPCSRVSVVVMRTVPEICEGAASIDVNARPPRPSPPARHAPPVLGPVRSRHSRNACAQERAPQVSLQECCSERNTVEAVDPRRSLCARQRAAAHQGEGHLRSAAVIWYCDFAIINCTHPYSLLICNPTLGPSTTRAVQEPLHASIHAPFHPTRHPAAASAPPA